MKTVDDFYEHIYNYCIDNYDLEIGKLGDFKKNMVHNLCYGIISEDEADQIKMISESYPILKLIYNKYLIDYPKTLYLPHSYGSFIFDYTFMKKSKINMRISKINQIISSS